MNCFQTPLRHCYMGNSQIALPREGDWICYHCNNLNFSFRKRCNRCKNQTREQNQHYANYYRLSDIPTHHEPLMDRTNFAGFTDSHELPSATQSQCLSPYYGSENKVSEFSSSPAERKLSFVFESSETSSLSGSELGWNLFLSSESQEWDSSFSDSSGQNSQENELLEYEIEQMVTKIII